MSSSTRELRERINNVSSVEQLVHAMNVVSSTKLVGAREAVEGVRPIYRELKRINEHIAYDQVAGEKHPYFTRRPVKKTLYLVLTSDTGLAGSYNSNILNKVLEHMEDKDEKIIVVGSNGLEFFKRRGKRVINSFYDISDENMYYGTESIAEQIQALYDSERVDEVYIAYTDFENILTLEPKVEMLLPMGFEDLEEDVDLDDVMILEPSENAFIDAIVPLYVHMAVFRAFTESHASEQAARSTAMDAASSNAKDLIEDLERAYNRQRQNAITQELTEIVSGAQSMKEGG